MSNYTKKYAKLAKLTNKQILSSLRILKKEYEENFSKMMITHNLENWTEHKKYTTIEKRLNSENIALLSEINCRSDMGVTQLIGNRY